MGCNHIVRLGSGVYLEKGRTPAYCWDGHKYVCADDFNDKEHLCLVYTFGLSNDPSFEEAMAAGGKQTGFKMMSPSSSTFILLRL